MVWGGAEGGRKGEETILPKKQGCVSLEKIRPYPLVFSADTAFRHSVVQRSLVGVYQAFAF